MTMRILQLQGPDQGFRESRCASSYSSCISDDGAWDMDVVSQGVLDSGSYRAQDAPRSSTQR